MFPYYLGRMWRRGGYRKDFSHRWGRLRHIPPKPQGVRRIWLQAVSVGELGSIRPLVAQLARLPDVEIIITSTTSTAYTLARSTYGYDVPRIYTAIFPLDFQPCSYAAWRCIEPDLAVLTETELWPEHLYQAWCHSTPVVLINGRLSDRSFRRYGYFKGVMRSLLKKLTLIIAASEQDADRFRLLGMDPAKVVTVGNIKFDSEPPAALDPEAALQLRRDLGFESQSTVPPLVILGASTWPEEEALLLDAFEDALASGIDCRLLLVPRHAERRRELIPLLERRSLAWHLRSSGQVLSKPVMVHVADTTGELSRLTQAADIAFIGKSMPPNSGGQTPLEAAACGVPILYGPHMNNFRQICSSLEAAAAAVPIAKPEALSPQLIQLLRNQQSRQSMGTAAREWHERNRGATQRTFERLQPFLKASEVNIERTVLTS